MKKVLFLSALFIGGVSIMSFTANKTNMADAIQIENLDDATLAAAAASFTESHSSYYDSDKNVWQEWHKTWQKEEEVVVDGIASVINAY